MEVTGLGSAYLDNFRLSSASTVHNSPDFEDMLERAAAEQKKAESERNAFYSGSPANVTSYSSKTPIDKTDKLYELCLELETFIIKNLLSSMRNTIQKTGLVDDSFAGKMYEDMLYDEYAKDFTRNANFGLAEQAYRQLKNVY